MRAECGIGIPPFTRNPDFVHCTKSGFCFYLAVIRPISARRGGGSGAHRKATAALLLPSAAFEPKVERMWSVQAAVQIAQRRDVGQIESVALVVCAIQFVNSSLAVTSRGSQFCEPSSSFARKGRFLRRVGSFFPKAARLGSKSPGFSPEGVALLPISPSFLGTARGGVQKTPPLSV